MEYIKAKTIVTRTKKPAMWFGCEYNMNIYRGCSHKCIYCDSRSDCYKDKNFDTIKAKENALEIIRDDLRRKVIKGVICTGAMSDPYNPLEKQYLLTRHSLELISAFGFGAAIATKSNLILRDLDILKEIKAFNPVITKISITTAHEDLSKIIEPNCSSTTQRFETIAKLNDEKIFSGVLMMPILPFINDNSENIMNLVDKAYEAGAKFIYPFFGLTLRDSQREYYYNKLDIHFPGLKEKYIKSYTNSYSCISPNIKNLWSVFIKKCNKYKIAYEMKDIIKLYRQGYENTQLKLNLL